MNIECIQIFLKDVVNRDTASSERMRFWLEQVKKQAVKKGEHDKAKLLWCYEQILRIQENYRSSFRQMREGAYYQAWCTLERIEIELLALERHYDIQDDTFKIHFINKHTRQFQLLYPYRVFSSPEMVKVRMVCSICNRPIRIRNPCGHLVGEIYRGEMCGRIITEVNFIGLSLVTNPSQRYSVLFTYKEGSDEEIDNYDYSAVEYVVSGLRYPFVEWNMFWTKTRHPHSRFKDVNPESNCPCGSKKSYRSCCLRKPGVLRPHLQISFSEPPPDGLPAFLYTK
jgi:hypothetical protein